MEDNNYTAPDNTTVAQAESKTEEQGLPNFKDRVELEELKNNIGLIKNEIGKVIVGQAKMIDLLLTAILADGHVLLEGAPGVAKTITAKLVARCISADFNRVQFTPDLMPSDVLGTSVFNMKNSEFEFMPGPVFSNIVLTDEINRAPAKTQAALFEVMEERQVTIDGKLYKMEAPYIVLATQNPIEQEGTYKLPEAQLDRFLFKIEIPYPELDDEVEILKRENAYKVSKMETVDTVISKEQLIKCQNIAKDIVVEDSLIKYIAQIVASTRNNPYLYLGASPRASIAILNASKAYAAIRGRDFVMPEDINFVAYPVLNHRVILTPEREMEGFSTMQVVEQIIKSVEVPR
ncbi:MAG: AAA family ATPase [Bacteroidales bacterium]